MFEIFVIMLPLLIARFSIVFRFTRVN